jgi:D-glycero-alpha-D-manno-heptose-7-phosphate kinase
MLFYTGIKRTASAVADSYVNNLEDKQRQLRVLQDLVDESISVLNGGQDLIGFGELLNEAWQAKRSLSASVSNSDVDDMYERALAAGAVGGKLTGAGGGGFMLLFAPPDRQPAVKDALNQLIHVPFKFEFSGSQIIHFDPEEDYSAQEEARTRQSIQAFRELTASSV